MAIFLPFFGNECRKKMRKLKIKKVDDKSLVIHTKKKAKIHTHEPKKVSIKDSNIYTGTMSRKSTSKTWNPVPLFSAIMDKLI